MPKVTISLNGTDSGGCFDILLVNVLSKLVYSTITAIFVSRDTPGTCES